MSKYLVKHGESIGDVVLNSTGSMNNWDAVLGANNFDSWTPDLVAGQEIIIPDSAPIDPNSRRQLSSYPACNSSVNDLVTKINSIFTTIYSNWILATTFWNDNAVWLDTKIWIE